MPPEESGGGYAPPSPLQQRLYVKSKAPLGATAFAPRLLRAKVSPRFFDLYRFLCLAKLHASRHGNSPYTPNKAWLGEYPRVAVFPHIISYRAIKPYTRVQRSMASR